MTRGRFHARGAAAGFAALGLLLWATPSHAQFSCDAGDLAGDCTINIVHNGVTGDTTVAGNLTITASGELNYGSGTAAITVGGDLIVDGLISADGSAGASGAAGADGNQGAAGGAGSNGTNGGDLTIDVAGSVTVSTDGSISVIGGAGGDGGDGGNSGGNNTGGAGGMAGNAGDGGSVTLNVCGDVDVEGAATGLITADGGDGGNGGAGGDGGPGNPGNGGDGGDGGDNGSGGTVEINADGTITIDGDVSALEGNVGSGGAGGTKGNAMGTDGSSGGSGSDVVSDGSITLNTAEPAVLGAGLPTTPLATKNVDQEPICAAVLDVTKELIESNGLDDFSVALAFGQIGVGLEEIQTFVYKITVTRRAVLGGEGEATEGVVIFDKVPAEYNLLCVEASDTACEVEDLMGVLDTDALAVTGECMVAVRRPDSAYKVDPPEKQPEIIIIEVGDLTASDDMCMVTVAVITDENPGNHEPPLFEPTGCLPATDKNGVLIRDDSQDVIVDWILLNEGLEGYDPVDGGLLFGPVAGLKLEPVGCPAPADSDGDDIPDVLDVCPDIPAGFVGDDLDSDDDGTADFEDGEVCNPAVQ